MKLIIIEVISDNEVGKEDEEINALVKVENGKYKCKICRASYITLRLLREHKTTHRMYKCDQCDKTFLALSYVRKHKKIAHTNEDKKVICNMCGILLKHRYYLKEHMARHLKNYTYKCEECDKGFYLKREYTDHRNIVHNGFRYVCKDCNKPFSNLSGYCQHLKTHKADYKPERKCKQCDQVFYSRTTLVKHVRNVHKQMQYICDVCGLSLTMLDGLKDHMRTHTGEKPFVCSTCGKSFKRRFTLNTHERGHSKQRPFKCKICDKCFTQNASLKVHMRIHSGERPYICNICNKGFITKSVLNIHTKVHGTRMKDA